MTIEKFDKKKYDAEFIKKHYKQYHFHLNLETENDLIELLERQSNKKAFIKTALLEFAKKQEKN